MKDIQKFWVQGSTKITQGIGKKITVALLGAAFALLLLAPISTKAAQAITQLEYIQWLVQVTGEGNSFTASSGASDYVQWAQSKGMNPSGGWDPGAKLTKEALAQTLVQVLNLSSSDKDVDYERILAREGMSLPEDAVINRGFINKVLGDPTLSPRLPFNGPGSPVRRGNNGLGNGEDPPPPGFLNPRNPHAGGGQNDGPGTSPGNPNPHNKP